MTRHPHPTLTLALAALVLATAPPMPIVQAQPVISEHRLANGLRVLIKDNPTTDLVAIEVLVRAAPRVEETTDAGISIFTREVMLRGTQRRTQLEVALALETVGGTLRALTSSEYTEWGTLTLTQHVDVALDLLADLLTAPKFDPADVEAQRRIQLSRIRAQADQPAARVFDLASSEIYSLHSYRNPLLGTVESVSSITREQIVNYYQTFYVASNMVVAIAGNVRSAVALAKVQRAFSGLRTGEIPRRVRLLPAVERALAPRPSEARRVGEVNRTAAAAAIAIAYLGVEVGHRDWAALTILNTILGSGASSRLFAEIRDKQGLVYTVGASFFSRAGPSTLTLTASTDPANLNRVIDAMISEVTRLATASPTPDELARAKNRFIGLHALSHEELRSQAFLPAFYELLGVGYEFDRRIPDLVSVVTGADVQRVARRYLQHPVIAVVQPPAR